MNDEPTMGQEDILDSDAQKEMTPEEYKKARSAAITGLKEEIKYLKVEEEYWRLVADIEEHKARKLLMIQRQLPFYTKQQPVQPEASTEGMPEGDVPIPEAAVDTPAGEAKPKRNLKTD